MKYNVKQVCIFHLILLGIPSNLMLSIKSKKVLKFNGQNLLSVTKVIYQQSLKKLSNAKQKTVPCLFTLKRLDIQISICGVQAEQP